MPVGYSGTPLVDKLGIKPGSRLALIRAPDSFERTLVGLPKDVRTGGRRLASPDLTIWFVSSAAQLEKGIAAIVKTMGAGLWIAWPKKASGVKTDLTEAVVRGIALAHGVVDYKVCAINATWSGLKFARRRAGK